MTSEHQAVQPFVIPRKGGNTQQGTQSSRLLDDIPLMSEDFRSHYWPIFCKHLSAHQKERNVSAIHCMAIRNNILEEKFKAFQKKLENQGDPSEISYAFYRLVGPPRETELIAQHGLFTGNTFIGDLGETSKGVHLNESPDLVTPAKFIESTRLRIMAFKVLKGRSNIVGLSSFTLEPTSGFASHVARPPPTADSLSRHEVFRYNQVYLYDESEPGVYSNVPANVLPFAVFTVDFAPNATTSFKYMPITLWNGVLKIGERRYADMTLQSCGGILIKPPFFGRVFEITDLVPWRACLDYPPIGDLLSLQMIGKLSTKKELLLNGVKRLATYFTLHPQYDNPQFGSLHESMRVRCVAGLSVLASGATVLVIPNGEFTSLLALPCREGPIFHILHFSKTLSDSLLTGTFEPFTPEENDDFNRLPNVGERVNGHDVDVKNIIEQLASECTQKEPCDEAMRNSPANNPVKDLPKHPDATPENLSPADMEIVSSDEEEASLATNIRPNRSKKQLGSSSNMLPQESKKTNETVSQSNTKLGNVKAITRVTYHRSRDPRQRPRTGANALPLPRVGMLPVPNLARVSSGSNLKDMTNEGRPADVQKKTQPEKEVTDEQRCYSPSQAISDEALSAGPSSPAELASPDQSSSTADESRTLKLKIPTVTLDDKGDVLSITNESPASPPIEKNVYVAQAPKIISGSDLRPPCGQSLHTSSHTYKAPEISLFANTAIPAISNFNLSSAGLKKLSEMGVRWGTSSIAGNQPVGSDGGRSSPWTTVKTDISNDREVSAASEQKTSADSNEGSSGLNQIDEKKSSLEAQVAEKDKPLEPDINRRSRWDTEAVATSAAADVDYRTLLPQLSVSCAPLVHGGTEPSDAVVSGKTSTGAALSASDRDDRTLLPFVGQSSEVATSSNPKVPRLLEMVPSPVSANSNDADRRSTIPYQPVLNQVRGGSRAGRPIPLNTIRPRQSSLLGERPPCFPPPMPSSGPRSVVPRSDLPRPPTPVFLPRPTFENITPGNFGFFNRPTPSTASHSAPAYSSIRGLDMPPDFPRGLSRKGIIVPDGRLFIQALLHPGRLRSLLERLGRWRQKLNIIWWLRVHSYVLKAVNGNNETIDAESDALMRYSSYNRLLGEFTTKGVVELLKAHECDDEVSGGIECNYLECVAKMAKESGSSCSIIFVTSIGMNVEMVRRYGSVGAEVCTFQQLMEKFGV